MTFGSAAAPFTGGALEKAAGLPPFAHAVRLGRAMLASAAGPHLAGTAAYAAADALAAGPLFCAGCKRAEGPCSEHSAKIFPARFWLERKR